MFPFTAAYSMLSLRALAAGFLLLLAFYTHLPEANAQEWPQVVQIEVSGLRYMTESEFRAKTRVRRGDTLTPDTMVLISEDLRRMYEEHGIRYEVQQEAVAGGIKLIFNVLEERAAPEIVKIEYRGASAKDFTDVVRTRLGDEYSEVRAEADVRRMTEHLRRDGHLRAAVSHRMHIVEPGRALVTFEVDKGPVFKLRKLYFAGNEAFTASQLRARMQTRGSLFAPSPRFNPLIFEQDIINLNQFYMLMGYRDASVSAQMIAFDYDKGRVDAVITIDEGPRYSIAEIELRGNELVDEETLRGLMRMQPGNYFSIEDLQADVQAIHTYYTTGDRGFAATSVTPDVITGEEPETVIVILDISEGRPTYIRRIDTSGNFLTRRKVIVREMRIQPGDLYNSDRIRDSIRRLRDLRYFDTVDVEISPSPPPEVGAVEDVDYIDLIVHVEEGDTGRLDIGGGYSTGTGVFARIGVEINNFDITDKPDFERYGLAALDPSRAFRGGGQRLRFAAAPGSERTYYSIDFDDPWFLDYPIEFGLSGYLVERTYDGFTLDRAGGSVSFGHRFTREFAATLRYRLENARVTDLDDDSPIEARQYRGSNRVGALTASTRYDTRDSIIFPTGGGIYRVWGEIAGHPVGGELGFWKAGIEGTIYQRLWDIPRGTSHVLRLGAETSFSGGAFGDDDVPIFERFFAGGIGSLRGFRYRGIGPRQTDPPNADRAVGGKFLFLAKAEYIIPLYKEDYQMYIFSDVGTLASETRADAFDELRATVGIGFRFYLPVVQAISLNYGIPVRKQPDDETERFSFSLGFLF